MTARVPNIISIRHPLYTQDELYWWEWRECYEGGEQYLNRNLKKFSDRETDADFAERKAISPIETYAKSAVDDIRNSIFLRLGDVIRKDGSDAYMRAVQGENGGVDNNGSTMQNFMGIEVGTELLVMGRVGIYIDAPEIAGQTLIDAQGKRPYIYKYDIEDILAWTASKPEEPGQFQALLLRDKGIDFSTEVVPGVELPIGIFTRYRLLWIDKMTGKVNLQFFDEQGTPIDKNGNNVLEIIELDLYKIPFVMPDIKGSVLKNVVNHQKALVNLTSSDVSYALKANFPFFTMQKDSRAVGAHINDFVTDEGTTGTNRNEKPGKERKIGTRLGITYPLGAERPEFINPSPEPLEWSMKLRENLEDGIRKLVNLEVQNKIGTKAISAEALKLSDQGLEAGLAFIGLVLEGAERAVAEHWSAYENKNPKRRKIAVIKYPDRYSLKSDKDRLDEAEQLIAIITSIPGREAKRELQKTIASALLSGKVSSDKLLAIYKEIDNADYTTSSPEIILQAVEKGLCDEKTGSMALGFAEDVYKQARLDHAARAKRILEAQTSAKMDSDPAARGLDDLSSNNDAGKTEKEESRETTLNEDKEVPVRGKGKSNNEDEE
jgi:hypothetical protein